MGLEGGAGMNKQVELTTAELALVVEALEDATFYRESRSRMLKSAVRRSGRGVEPTSDVHRPRAEAMRELALPLKRDL